MSAPGWVQRPACMIIVKVRVNGTCLSLLVAALAGLSGCGSSYRCTGPAIQCESFTPASCEDVPGCVAGDVCGLYSSDGPAEACAAKATATTCVAPRCSWSGSACMAICSTISDMQTCYSTHAVERADPPVDYVWQCNWVHCHGKPVRSFCSDYSNESCPRDLGCSVERTNEVGDVPRGLCGVEAERWVARVV